MTDKTLKEATLEELKQELKERARALIIEEEARRIAEAQAVTEMLENYPHLFKDCLIDMQDLINDGENYRISLEAVWSPFEELEEKYGL